MTQRWSAPLCCCLAAMLHSSGAAAGVWGVDPVLGLTGDYATNPALLPVEHTDETNGALLLDVPATFNGDAWKLSLVPSFRLGDARGYSSVLSDYEHFTVKGEWDTERSTLTSSLGVARDSSLYADYLTNGTAGVRRDTATADVDWDRFLSERIEVNTDANSMRVRFGEAVGAQTLVDYQYSSITPTLALISAEKDRFTLSASVGRYDSLDGTTESRNGNLQLGFVRQLTEQWSLTATGGYSRALNRVDYEQQYLVLTPSGPVIESIPIKFESAQDGAIYSVDLAHQGKLLLLDAIASRQVIPSGFALLSRQNTLELKAAYTMTPRWSLDGDAQYKTSIDPLLQSQLIDRTITFFAFHANWKWTEHLTLTLGVSRLAERTASPSSVINYFYNLASSEVSITLSKQFNRLSFQ
jgi:hypothetical protein